MSVFASLFLEGGGGIVHDRVVKRRWRNGVFSTIQLNDNMIEFGNRVMKCKGLDHIEVLSAIDSHSRQ